MNSGAENALLLRVWQSRRSRHGSAISIMLPIKVRLSFDFTRTRGCYELHSITI